ncbi:hypothetical protein [Lysobacter gummosus]|uniref:hypothetical protein n=1 Tax=Lysobacter gummosus TaxID=262324 RepID=UPI00363B50CE
MSYSTIVVCGRTSTHKGRMQRKRPDVRLASFVSVLRLKRRRAGRGGRDQRLSIETYGRSSGPV